jgi:hypothetical protein
VTTVKPPRRMVVPWHEIEPLLSQASQASDASRTAVLETIGWSDSVATAWRKAGEAPTKVKYGLIGLLADLRVPHKARAAHPFDTVEISYLMVALNQAQLPANIRRDLLRKLAKEMQEVDE